MYNLNIAVRQNGQQYFYIFAVKPHEKFNGSMVKRLIILLSGKQLFTLILFCCSVFYSNIY